MYIGTLHSIFLRYLEEYREFTRLKKSYKLFDQFDQRFFIYSIIKPYVAVENSEELLGDFKVSSWVKAELIANVEDLQCTSFKDKSFHLDNYCFDSYPESYMFNSLLKDEVIEKVWFTGMLTHGQSDLLIRYTDPESHTVWSYYPDFLVKVKTPDNSEKYIIIEVKEDNKINDAIAKAKGDYASQLAISSGMTYDVIKGSDAHKKITV